MSDTYNYNAGSPFGGLSGLFGGGFGCNDNNGGFNLMSLLGFAIVAGVLGITPNGGFGGWGGRGGYDNRDEQGQYNRQYEYPRNGYEPRAEHGYSPSNTMGFDPEQNRHEYGRPHSAYQNDEREFDYRMDDYFRRINEGRTRVPDSLCEVVATGVQMYMGNSRGGSDREWKSEDGEETHRRYKAAIERLREEKEPNAKERLMKELFEDLTPDEMVVLREKAKAKPYRELAREKCGNNATADRWVEAMKNLKHKLKHTA